MYGRLLRVVKMVNKKSTDSIRTLKKSYAISKLIQMILKPYNIILISLL